MNDTPPSIDELLNDVTSDDRERRWAAIQHLGKLNSPQAIEILTQVVLHDPSESIASMVAWTLTTTDGPQNEEALLTALSRRSIRVQQVVIFLLGQLKSEQAIEPLAELLCTEPDLRFNICETLVKIGPATVSSLIPMLTHPASHVRQDVAYVLGQIGDPQAFDPLMVALTDRVSEVRAAAAYGLGVIGNTRAVPPLIELLTDRDTNARESAAVALGKLQDRRAVTPLRRQLNDSDENVRCNVAKALGKLEDADAFVDLLPLLHDPSKKVVIEVIVALSRVDGERAIEILIPMLSHTQFAIRETTATAFGRIGAPALLPLVNAAHDATGEGLWHTGSAIARITDPSTTTTHIQLLHHEIDRVGYAAYEALRKIGTPAALAAIEAWERERRARGG